MLSRLLIGALTAAVVCSAVTTEARVTRIEIVKVESPAPAGRAGATSLPYERLSGKAYGELDPNDPKNAIVTDIKLAPRNARGKVEYAATFSLMKPIDMSQSSGVLIYSVVNRGGGAATASAEGHVSLVSGWQADVVPTANNQTIQVPVAKRPDGTSVTGPLVLRFTGLTGSTTTIMIPRNQPSPYPPATLDTSKASLVSAVSESATGVKSGTVVIVAGDWAFADCAKTPFPGTPDPGHVCVKGGFNPALLYELQYTAKDPLVLGIGFAATRDINSFFRYEQKDDAGTPNPVAGRIRWGVSEGSSQSGTFLRAYIHLGFNQDEKNRIVWDGSNPHIASRVIDMNRRFALPGGTISFYELGVEAPVWWEDWNDTPRGRGKSGLLDRCRISNTCPKIVETFGSSEFYNLRASPDLVGTRADRDIPLPPNVRRYYFPGVSHGGGPGGFDPNPQQQSCCELLPNPNPSSDTLRALQTALVDWVAKGVLPPPSQYPRLDRGELVAPTQAAMGFPAIPGVPLPDGILTQLYQYDFGPQFHYNDLSGVITMQPPPVRQILPTVVSRVDGDGNEVAGVASVLHQVPLGTYTGWNTNASGFYKGHIRTNTGAFIPFAKTKAERLTSGDARPSLEERYGTHEKYVAQVRTAAERLVRGRYLLQDDADRLIAQAEASKVLK